MVDIEKYIKKMELKGYVKEILAGNDADGR